VNVAYPGPWPKISEADALLIDVARRIQPAHSVVMRGADKEDKAAA